MCHHLVAKSAITPTIKCVNHYRGLVFGGAIRLKQSVKSEAVNIFGYFNEGRRISLCNEESIVWRPGPARHSKLSFLLLLRACRDDIKAVWAAAECVSFHGKVHMGGSLSQVCASVRVCEGVVYLALGCAHICFRDSRWTLPVCWNISWRLKLASCSCICEFYTLRLIFIVIFFMVSFFFFF